MDKENGSGGGSSKHKSSNNSNRQPTIDVNDPSSLLNAASLFGELFLIFSFDIEPASLTIRCCFEIERNLFCFSLEISENIHNFIWFSKSCSDLQSQRAYRSRI